MIKYRYTTQPSLVPTLLGGGVGMKQEPGTHCLCMHYYILTFQDIRYLYSQPVYYVVTKYPPCIIWVYHITI